MLASELQLKVRLFVLTALSAITVAVWVMPVEATESPSSLLVHFLDVGQGDATLIESPDGTQVLIDGGVDNQVLRSLASKLGFFDRTIDYLVATHPDADHIGGLIDVLERYDVQHIIMTDNAHESTVVDQFTAAAQAEGAMITLVRRGDTIDVGAGAVLQTLWPETSVVDMESNAASIVMKLVYGNTSFVLTGDAPKRIEEYLVLTHGEYMQSDVLKVGHHGSRTSTSELFVAEVDPTYAVISASADNRYGHPHVEVTDTLFNQGVTTVTTATQGTITFESDGYEVWRTY